MRQYTIEISETTYNLLDKQATAQNSTLEKVIERLLINTSSVLQEDNNTLVSILPDSINGALAAVQRLTSLFADVKIRNLEAILDDPMIDLANVDLNMDLI